MIKQRIIRILLCLTLFLAAVFAQGFCTAACALAPSAAASALAPAKTSNDGIRLPILMYHLICPGKHSKYVVPPQTLEADFQYLKRAGFTPVFASEVIRHCQNGAPLPAKPVMLTFDDGNRSVYVHAFPLLKKYNFKAVMAVVGSFTDEGYHPDGSLNRDRVSTVTYAHIKEMHQSGLVEIQNHTDNLHKSGARLGIKQKAGESKADYEAVLKKDLSALEKKLRDKCGVTCNTVVYPFGAYTKETAGILKKLGYQAALTCNEGINYLSGKTDLFLLKRYNRAWGRDIIKLTGG